MNQTAMPFILPAVLIILFFKIFFSFASFTKRGFLKYFFILSSYFGAILASYFSIYLIAGVYGRDLYTLYPLIFISVPVTFIIRRSEMMARALDVVMSAFFSCILVVYLMEATPFAYDGALCMVGYIIFYDLWFMATIISFGERVNTSSWYEFIAAFITVFAASIVSGTFIYRVTFYEAYGADNNFSLFFAVVSLFIMPLITAIRFINSQREKPLFYRLRARLYSNRLERERKKYRNRANSGKTYHEADNDRQNTGQGGQEFNGYNEKKYTGYESGDHRNSEPSGFLTEEIRSAMWIFGINSISGLKKDWLDKERRRLMKEHHPDMANDDGKMAGEINAAYDILRKYAD